MDDNTKRWLAVIAYLLFGVLVVAVFLVVTIPLVKQWGVDLEIVKAKLREKREAAQALVERDSWDDGLIDNIVHFNEKRKEG